MINKKFILNVGMIRDRPAWKLSRVKAGYHDPFSDKPEQTIDALSRLFTQTLPLYVQKSQGIGVGKVTNSECRN
jgi:hypothetical protein